MLKIRLQRTGRINQPSFRIVVIEHARATKSGSPVEQLGTYNPRSKVRTLNAERVKYWMSVGAQPSPTVYNMLVTEGIISGAKKNVIAKTILEKKPEPVAEEVPATEPKAAEEAPVAAEAVVA